MPISVYSGEEVYLMQQALRELRGSIVSPDSAGLSHQIITNPHPQQLGDQLGATSLGLLMGGMTLVEVHDFEPLSKAYDPADEKSIEALKETLLDIIENNTPNHVLFVSKKINKTVKFAKWLTSNKTLGATIKEFKPLAFWEGDKAIQFLMQYAQKQHIKLQAPAAALLVEQMGVDLQVLVNELEKLAVYTAGKPVSVEAVKALANHNDNVFAMLEDWMRQANTAQVYTTLDEILLRKHPVELFALIETRLNNIFQMRHWEQLGLSQAEIASRAKKHPFVVKKDLQAFGNISMTRLSTLRQKTLHYEQQSKSGGLNPRLALEMLLGV